MPELDGEVKIEFEVYCDRCGAGLCNNISIRYDFSPPRILVDPCEKCLEKEYDEGHDAGYKLAEEDK